MNEKKVTIITIACLAFILLAGGGLIYYLQFVKLDELKIQLKNVTEQRDQTKAKVDMIPGLKKEIAKLEVDVKSREGKIPNLDRAEYDRFANLLDDLRRRSGVVVSRGAWVVPSKPSPVSGSTRPVRNVPVSVHKVQYDLAVSGGFYQLLRYLNLVEQQGRFINVQELTIAKSSSNPSEKDPSMALQRDMKLTLFSYTYRPPPEVLLIPKKEEQRKGKSTDLPD